MATEVKRKVKKYQPKTVGANQIEEEWFEIDAEGKRLGLVASTVAELLLGKNNPLMRDYLMPKNKVIIVNADKLDITEQRKNKVYTRYSGYPSGLKTETLGEVMVAKPKKALERAIKGMLPKGSRGRKIFSDNLKVYAEPTHEHEAQQPKKVTI